MEMRTEKTMQDRMLCKSSKYILGYKNGMLIVRDSKTKGILYKKRIHPWLKSSTLIERFLRLDLRVAFARDDSKFIYSDHGAVYELNADTGKIEWQHNFSRGMNNPLSFCVRTDENGAFLDAVYGEYFWNPEHGPVSIYRLTGNKWTKEYAFPAGSVTHIHNIVFDSYRKRYIIMTGDRDEESAIWEASSDFQNVKMIAGGKQCYRACVANVVENGIFYATDTPLEQNWLCFLSEDGLHQIYALPGPCIYGAVRNGCLYLATSVEGDPTLGKWKYRFSNKLGKGVSDRYVHIFRCDRQGRTEELTQLKKDFLPMWLFQFGNAIFPPTDDGVYFGTQSTVQKGTYRLVE